MEDEREQVVSLSTEVESAEERMLREALVREIARELGVDGKTVKRWLRLGGWQPRQPQRRERQLDPFAEFIERSCTGSRVQWSRALPRAAGFGLNRWFDAGAAFRQAVPRAAQMVGAGHDALRDRTG